MAKSPKTVAQRPSKTHGPSGLSHTSVGTLGHKAKSPPPKNLKLLAQNGNNDGCGPSRLFKPRKV